MVEYIIFIYVVGVFYEMGYCHGIHKGTYNTLSESFDVVKAGAAAGMFWPFIYLYKIYKEIRSIFAHK